MNKDMSINIREYSLSEMEDFIENKINDDFNYWEKDVLKLEELDQSRMSSISMFKNNDLPSGKPLVSMAFKWNDDGNEFHLEFFGEEDINDVADILTVFVQMSKAIADYQGA